MQKKDLSELFVLCYSDIFLFNIWKAECSWWCWFQSENLKSAAQYGCQKCVWNVWTRCNVFEWLTAPSYIQKVCGSQLGSEISYPDCVFCVVFITASKEMPGFYLRWGDIHFLILPISFVVLLFDDVQSKLLSGRLNKTTKDKASRLVTSQVQKQHTDTASFIKYF